VPIVCLHPLPIQLCLGYLSVLAAELGCMNESKLALAPLRKSLIVPDKYAAPAGVQEPGRAATKLPGIILYKERATQMSAPMLRTFAQGLLLSVFNPGKGATEYIMPAPPDDKEMRMKMKGPDVRQKAVLNDIRTILVALEVAVTIADDALKMQMCSALYAVVAPLLDAKHKPKYSVAVLTRIYETLCTVAPDKLCETSDDEAGVVATEARSTMCLTSYQLLELFAELSAEPTAQLVLTELVAKVKATAGARVEVGRVTAQKALNKAAFGDSMDALKGALKDAGAAGVDAELVTKAQGTLEAMEAKLAEDKAAAKAARLVAREEAYAARKTAFDEDVAEEKGEFTEEPPVESEDEAEPAAEPETEDAPEPAASPWDGLEEWQALVQHVLTLPAGETPLQEVVSASDPGEGEESALAGVWAKLREAGPAAAVAAAQAMAGDDVTEALKQISLLCTAALKSKAVQDAKDLCDSARELVTKQEKGVEFCTPAHIKVEDEVVEEDPEAEEDELADQVTAAAEGYWYVEEKNETPEERVEQMAAYLLDTASLDKEKEEDAEAVAKVEGIAAELVGKRDAKEHRASEFITASLKNLHEIRMAKATAREKVSKESQWRASLELTCAQARFILWRDAGAEAGIVEVDPEAPEPDPAEEKLPVEWQEFLMQVKRAVVLAQRSESWVQLDSCTKTFFNISTWLQSHLPAAADVTATLVPLAREIAKSCVEMLLTLKEGVEVSMEAAAAKDYLDGVETAATSSDMGGKHWFDGVKYPDATSVAKIVMWCLNLQLEKKSFGAVAETAARLNFVTNDIYAEMTLPMIITAKKELAEDSYHAEARLMIIDRDKPMAKQTLDSARATMKHYWADQDRVVSTFETTIALMREKRETLLLCQALNELGDYYFQNELPIEASISWTDGVDAAFGVFASVKEWRDIFEGSDGNEHGDAEVLKTVGIWELCMAVTMLGKLSKFVHRRDAHMRLECCLMAARATHVMYSADLSHPHKLREFARFQPQQLWCGVDLFDAPEICTAAVLMEMVEYMCTELESCDAVLEAMPMLALYIHIADGLLDTFHSIRCALLRVQVLTKAGLLEEASATLADISKGTGVPGLEGVSTETEVSLLQNQLAPDSTENVAAVGSVCAIVLPAIPESSLSPDYRDFLDCHLVCRGTWTRATIDRL
jgi:hypothetical protein